MILTGMAMTFGLRIPFLGSGPASGLWFAFIGWFLNGASVQSYRRVVVRDILEDVPVARVMRPSPPTVPSSASVSDLVNDYLMVSDDHCFPVLDGTRFVGLVTLEDVRSTSREAWDTTPVREIMTPAEELATVAGDDDAAEALDRLMSRDVRQLPVMSHGSLAGLLRRRDIVRWLHLHSELGVG
jgi:CBS domain-containing protein